MGGGIVEWMKQALVLHTVSTALVIEGWVPILLCKLIDVSLVNLDVMVCEA